MFSTKNSTSALPYTPPAGSRCVFDQHAMIRWGRRTLKYFFLDNAKYNCHVPDCGDDDKGEDVEDDHDDGDDDDDDDNNDDDFLSTFCLPLREGVSN